jgi:hypothetical protein
MAQTRQVSAKELLLAQTIPGYKGYISSKVARQTDQAFSEELLDRLSETVAMVARMKRSAGDGASPELLPSLSIITDHADRLAKQIVDSAPGQSFLDKRSDSEKVSNIVDLDSAILEKIGNINQTLSMMDLEGGIGTTEEEVESVCELLDDLDSYLRTRAVLLAD